MTIHGVDETGGVKLSNMQFLYDEMCKADRIMNF